MKTKQCNMILLAVSLYLVATSGVPVTSAAIITVDDDGVADDVERYFGGYHARLWEMSNGDVVANAHHDDSAFNIPLGHQADEYEPAEDLVAGFFDYDLTNWWVLYDQCELDNEHTNPYGAYNDGDATCIYRVGS